MICNGYSRAACAADQSLYPVQFSFKEKEMDSMWISIQAIPACAINTYAAPAVRQRAITSKLMPTVIVS